jgi:DNA-binding NtrC family response regulator
VTTVLIVEDKQSLARMLLDTMEAERIPAEWIGTADEAIRKVEAGARWAAVVTDLRLPGSSGTDLLRVVKEHDPECPVIVMTGYGTIEDAVEAMKAGASDFIQKPVDIDYLLLLVRRGIARRRLELENILLREDAARRPGFPAIVGESAAMKEVSNEIRRVAPTDATVLLTGETGTGKELFARAIHGLSPRASRAFVAINCAAIPDTLIESELFGHEKGSFTGATARQIGRFELADGGTVFLDEIGELGFGVQAKVLRVLQERTFERLGGRMPITVDVRVICATNRNLPDEIAAKRFREDLYYRINAFPVAVPPLRARREDIDSLVDHFVERFSRELGRRDLSMSDEARATLRACDWPGNVRELENCIERAVILAEGRTIRTADLRIGARSRGAGQALRECFDLSGTLPEVVDRVSRAVEELRIREAIAETGSRAAAAERLGITLRALSSRMKDLGIE